MTKLVRTSAAPPVRHVHLGLGNFFRAHQAWYTEHADDGADWGIAAFTGRSPDLARALAGQEGLFTLVTRAGDGDLFEIVRSVARAHAADDHDAWLDYFVDPAVRLVTTTVTEAGYLRSATGGLDVGRPEVRADLGVVEVKSDGVGPYGAGKAGGWVGRASAGGRRSVDDRAVRQPAGERLGREARAAASSPIFSIPGWQSGSPTRCPSRPRWSTGSPLPPPRLTSPPSRRRPACMTVRPVVTEPFTEWVISGQFLGGRPRWEDAGATFADDVAPFEERKLWLLNGAHSMLAYAGSIRGHVTVAEAMRDETCREWLDQWWDAAAVHLTLPAVAVAAYRDALTQRFENPRMQHRLDQIAFDGSQKLPIRILPALRREVAAGRVLPGATRPVAAWICHLRGLGAAVTDARADEFVPLAVGPLSEAVPMVIGALDPALAADSSVVAAILAQTHELESYSAATLAATGQ